jgi:glycolate oxidase iron-sulfur subunit
MAGRFFGPRKQVYPARAEKKLTVGLLSGCVMPLMQGDTMAAAVRVLTRNGCDVMVPQGQGCCGALNLHSGDLERSRAMARRNIDVFLQSGVDRVVVASAGCSSAMKEYPDLLRDDDEYLKKAEDFSRRTVDINELLASLPVSPPRAALKVKVTYQDPCHLAHAQGITAAPREILKAIPGVDLVEMEQSTMCCGGAGIYSAVQPTLSRRILSRKVEAIIESGASEAITANPGCMMQLEQGLRAAGQKTPVRHVVDILDEAYRLEEPAPERARRGSSRRRGPMPLQMDLEEAQASQYWERRRRGHFGLLPGSSRRRPRSR